MKLKYEELIDQLGSKILKATFEDGREMWIPMDEANSDYQAYLNKDKPQEVKP
jgi:hypothetical protein